MPYHYKQFKPGTPQYRKAYAEHLIKKLKKKRGNHSMERDDQYAAAYDLVVPDPEGGGPASG